MQQKFRSVFVITGPLALFMILTACGTIPKHVSESQIPHDRWPIELNQPDEDLIFVGSKFGEASPSLLMTAFDGMRNSWSENAYAPVLAFAERHSLNDVFLDRIQESNVLRLLSRNGEIIASDSFDYTDIEGGFIAVAAAIELTHDLSTLLVRLQFNEYTPGALGYSMNGIFQKYYYVYRLDEFDEGKSRSEFAEQWTELGERRFIEIVESGINETIQMMKTYLTDPNPELNSDQEYYVEGHELWSWRSRAWGGNEEVTWLVKGDKQHLFFAAPKEFIQEAEWEEATRP
jgi:hypothetical protein